jgi:hypothetical protein
MAVGIISTGIAALIGTVFTLIMTLPLSILVIFFPFLLIVGAALGVVMAAPVTLGLLPLTYQLVRGLPVLAQLIYPAVGLVGGGAIMQLWSVLGLFPFTQNSHDLFAIGMIPGLIAGAFYGRGVHP